MPKQKTCKRQDGRFVCRRGEMYFYGSTAAEAQSKRAAYDRMIADGLRHDQAGITLSEYADEYLKTYRSSCSPAVANQYRKILFRFVDFVGNVRLRDVCASDIKRFYVSIEGYCDGYISRARGLICGLFKAACNDRIIITDPTVGVRPKKGKTGTHRSIESWEREAINALADQRMGIVVFLMLYAGLRRGEAVAINFDTDIRDGRIYVSRSVSFAYGSKGVIKEPKTKAGIRDLPLIEPLKSAVQGKHGQAYVSSSGFISAKAVQEAWTAYKHAFERLSGRPCTIRMHDLRHSFCTMLFDAGVDMHTAVKWMGHSDFTMIQKIYDHLTEYREKNAEQKLADSVEKMLNRCQNGCQNEKDGSNALKTNEP